MCCLSVYNGRKSICFEGGNDSFMLDEKIISTRGRETVRGQRLITNIHKIVYRATKGAILGRVGHSSVLLLTTTGRKSGKQFTTPLYYLADGFGQNMVLVASDGGALKHPLWWLNLQVNPEATVEVRGRKLRVVAREADPEERKRLWPLLVEMYSGYEAYQKKTERQIPIVLLRPL